MMENLIFDIEKGHFAVMQNDLFLFINEMHLCLVWPPTGVSYTNKFEEIIDAYESITPYWGFLHESFLAALGLTYELLPPTGVSYVEIQNFDHFEEDNYYPLLGFLTWHH